jgi:hypothetical protein
MIAVAMRTEATGILSVLAVRTIAMGAARSSGAGTRGSDPRRDRSSELARPDKTPGRAVATLLFEEVSDDRLAPHAPHGVE